MVSKARKDHARATKNNPKSTYSANDTPVDIQPSFEVRNAEPGSLVEDYRQFEKRVLHFDEKYKVMALGYLSLPFFFTFLVFPITNVAVLGLARSV